MNHEPSADHESAPNAPPTPPGRNLIWRVLHVPFRWFCRWWLHVEAEGLEHIDNTRGGLLLLNHQSYLDPLLAAVLMRRPVAFLARDSLFRVPLLGALLRRTYVIPISRQAVRSGSIRDAIQRLEEGHLVGIFPEGTRSSGNDVQTFRPGFLAMVRRTNLPVYPVAIAGADRVFPRGAWFVRPGRIRIVYGTPLTQNELLDPNNGSDDKALAEFARSRVAECHIRAQQLLNSST